jgi:probable HAF family extracellular repeat protein
MSAGYGINNSGQVVGYTQLNRVTQNAVIWNGTSPTDIVESRSKGYAINNSGQVVGEYGMEHPFLWDNGTFTDLDPEGYGTVAYGINDSGQVVGTCSSTGHAFRWDNSQTGMVDLGTLPDCTYSEGKAINNSGHIVGSSYYTPDWGTHAFIWKNDQMVDLNPEDSWSSWAFAVNDLDHVAGSASLMSNDGTNACFWDENGDLTDLGTLGEYGSEAGGMNNRDQVVGWSAISESYNTHAFIWDNGLMRDLNSLVSLDPGWYLTDAKGINDAGQIVATAMNDGGEAHAVLLTPAPEPVTAAFLVLGGLSLLRRRKS